MLPVPGFSAPRALIDHLCQQKGRNDDLGQLLAKTLKTNINAFFKKVMCCIHELLQNADDPENAQLLKEKSVTFLLSGQELIFYHMGRPFNEQDVRGICNYNDIDNPRKSGEEDQTGYKGIGFKSVFRMASRVDIWSNEWHFHFDEDSDKWKNDKGNYPWQIAPSWTEEESLSPKAREIANVPERTTFIFKIRNERIKELSEILYNWSHHSTTILFLKKISQIHIELPNCPRLTTCVKTHDSVRTIFINDQVQSTWLYRKEEIKKTKDIQAYLELDDTECPKRLETCSTIKLSFAYPLKKENNNFYFHAIEKGKFFFTLPLEEVSGMHFYVDAHFLPDQARTFIPENEWNIFLIEQIARRHFEHVRDYLKDQVFDAFRIFTWQLGEGLNKELKQHFNQTMEELIRKEAFIPPLMPGALLKITDCIQDDERQFHETLWKQKQSLKGKTNKIVHPNIKEEDFFEKFKIRKLTLKKIIESLPKKINLELSKALLQYFCKVFPIHNQPRGMTRDLNALKQKPFILSDKNQLVALEDKGKDAIQKEGFYLCFSVNDVKLPDNLPFSLLHPDLRTEETETWLREKMGIKELTPSDIVIFYRDNLEDKSLNNRENNLAIIQFLFWLYNYQHLDETHLNTLKGIKLFSILGKFCSSHTLYLPSQFEPLLDIEKALSRLGRNKKNIFVAEDYLEKEEEEDLTEKDQKKWVGVWKDFFLSIGVKENCEFIEEEKISVKELKKIPFAYIYEYLKSIFNVPEEELPVKSRQAQDGHCISPFTGFSYIQLMPLDGELNAFILGELKKKEDNILNNYASSFYHASQQRRKQNQTYLQWVFQNNPLLKDQTGDYKNASELYASSMKDIIPAPYANLISIADIPVEFSSAMEEFLGFKKIFSAGDCFTFLQELQKKYDHQFYKLVMKHLLLNLKKNKELDVREWKLQASNGDWKQVKFLQFRFDPSDSPKWIKNVLSEEMQEFCRLAKIKSGTPTIESHLLQRCKRSEALKSIIKSRMPAIAYYYYYHWRKSKSELEVIKQIVALEELNFHVGFVEEEEDYYHLHEFQHNCLYIFLPKDADVKERWQDHSEFIADSLRKYLKFDNDELYTIKQGLLGRSDRRPSHYIPFQKALETYHKQHAQTSHKKQKTHHPSNMSRSTEKDEDDLINVSQMEHSQSFSSHEPPTSPSDPSLRKQTSSPISSPKEQSPPSSHRAGKSKRVLFPPSSKRSTQQTNSSSSKTTASSSSTSRSPKQNNSRPIWNPTISSDLAITNKIQKIPDSAISSPNRSTKLLLTASRTPKRKKEEQEPADSEDEKRRREIEDKKIGHFTEERILNTLIKKYTNPDQTDKPREKFNRIPDNPLFPGQVTLESSNRTITFMWFNDPRHPEARNHKKEMPWDSHHLFDIQKVIINKEGKEIKTRWIEVKGTPRNDIHFFLKSNQWQLAIENPDKYRLYVVTKVGTNEATPHVYRNLLTCIQNQRLRPISTIQFKGMKEKEEQEEQAPQVD